MEDNEYLERQKRESESYESLCRCCGVCCGSRDNDPCAHLVRRDDGKYNCAIYNARFGVQKTVSGKEFTCVPIRDVINFGVHYEGCGYNDR